MLEARSNFCLIAERTEIDIAVANIAIKIHNFQNTDAPQAHTKPFSIPSPHEVAQSEQPKIACMPKL